MVDWRLCACCVLEADGDLYNGDQTDCATQTVIRIIYTRAVLVSRFARAFTLASPQESSRRINVATCKIVTSRRSVSPVRNH